MFLLCKLGSGSDRALSFFDAEGALGVGGGKCVVPFWQWGRAGWDMASKVNGGTTLC